VHHELRRSASAIGLGERKLDALVLADSAIEEDPLLGIVGPFENHLASPIHSAAMRMRSASMPKGCSERLALLDDEVSAGIQLSNEYLGGGVVNQGRSAGAREPCVLAVAFGK